MHIRRPTGFVELYTNELGEERFRVKGLNGEIVAQGQAYTRPDSAMEGVRALRRILRRPLYKRVDA